MDQPDINQPNKSMMKKYWWIFLIVGVLLIVVFIIITSYNKGPFEPTITGNVVKEILNEEKIVETSEITKETTKLQEKPSSFQDDLGELSLVYDCTKLCAGETFIEPFFKNKCYMKCYSIYKHAGEEGLKDFMSNFE